MPFKFKELSELKENLQYTKNLMLMANSKKEVDELHEPRRSEILYLEAILNSLIEYAKKPKAVANLSAIYYGAVLTVLKDSNDLHGKLATNLMIGIGLDPNKPTEGLDLLLKAQCHRMLNSYLQAHLFKDSDLRNPIEKGHLLTALDKDKSHKNMNRLVHLGYQIECDAQNAMIRSLPSEQMKISTEHYAPKKATPPSALLSISWPSLRRALEDLILKELTSKPKKNALGITYSYGVNTIEDLGLPRSAQLKYLKTIETLLHKSTTEETEKVAILTGAMHFVLKQIHAQYTIKANLSNSVVYTQLVKILNPELDESQLTQRPDSNFIEPQDVESLLQAANQFTHAMTIYTPSASNKKAFIEQNPFEGIAGFDIKNILCEFSERITECRHVAFENKSRALEIMRKLQEAGADADAAATPSWKDLFSGLSLFSKREEEEEEEAQAASAAPQKS